MIYLNRYKNIIFYKNAFYINGVDILVISLDNNYYKLFCNTNRRVIGI